MALNDWTQRNLGSPTVEIENFVPIVGIGSLRSTGITSLVTLTEDNYSLGLTRGKIRSLIRIDDFTGSESYDAGFFFMASLLDLTGGTGQTYTCSINGEAATTGTRVQVQYHIAGLETAPEVLFSGPDFDREDSIGPLINALEVEWVYEPDLLNGTLITIRHGIDPLETDFSNLSEIGKIILYEEDVRFLGTSVAEGVYMDSRGGGGDVDAIFDDTRISVLIPV